MSISRVRTALASIAAQVTDDDDNLVLVTTHTSPPAKLDRAELPAAIVTAGQARYDSASSGAGFYQEERQYRVQIIAQMIASSTPAEIEAQAEALIPLFVDAYMARPSLGLGIGDDDGPSVQSAIVSDSGVIELVSGTTYVGFELSLVVVEFHDRRYAPGE